MSCCGGKNCNSSSNTTSTSTPAACGNSSCCRGAKCGNSASHATSSASLLLLNNNDTSSPSDEAVTTTGGQSVKLNLNRNTQRADSHPLKDQAKSIGSIWPVSSLVSGTQQQASVSPIRVEDLVSHEDPLETKCGANHRTDGQCCKDLKGDDERHLINPDIIRDVIIGLSDGLTVPFALTAGLSSIGSTKLVITGGLAELCAGAISMGLGGFLASQAELDHFHYLRKQTSARVLRSCAGEMEREVHAILGPLGVKEALSRLVAGDLRAIEDGTNGLREGDGNRNEGIVSATRGGARSVSDEEALVKGDPNVGLTAFLLKFGEGLEEVPRSRLWISALTIGLSYFIGGLIPLIPYMATSTANEGLLISAVVTCVILLIFGGFKTYFTGASGGYIGYIWGSFSTMVVGGLAAAAAYGLVKALGVKE